MPKTSKTYITTEQRNGTLIGFVVEDYRINIDSEEDISKIEKSPLFKTGRIKEYKSTKQVETKKTFLDTVFTDEEQEVIESLLSPAEIKDAINLLIASKKEKTPDPPAPLKITEETYTPKELKDMLTEMNVAFKGNASKKDLFALYKKALAEKSESGKRK